VDLSPRQQRALAAICDTFVPGEDGLPSASALGVPDLLSEAVDGNPRASERKQLAQLLGLWDTKAFGALNGAGWNRFSELSQEEREKLLLSFCDSRLPQKRAIFQALRKGAVALYYMAPGPNGTPNPAWDAIGYPGPLGKRDDPPPPELETVDPTVDMQLDCDVVVVGSGAGGGTAAGVLATAGLDVVVIESGRYYYEADFAGDEQWAIQNLYAGAPAASHDQSVGLVAGSCVGGGTVVNYSTSFRTPDAIREEWAAAGVPAFAGEEYTQSLDAVCERLGVNQEHAKASSRDEMMERGLRELGWHVDAMPRNVRGCDQGIDCGRCGYGCRLGAKQSTAKTWLVDAQAAGARIVVGTRADRVTTSAGKATGVEATTVGGHRVTVRARAVVAAAGAIQTPALLKRSGLTNSNVGKHLVLHPATPVYGLYDEELRPWEGAMQSRYSDEHTKLDGNWGVKYETGPLNPALFLNFAPWRSGTQHARMTADLPHVAGIALILRDRYGGEVRVGRDGQPVVRYKLSDYDKKHLRKGLEGCVRIHEAAGAQRIWSPQAKWVSYEPGRNGGVDRFMADADAAGYGPGQIILGSFHIMGSARMGGSPQTSACDAGGETWDVRNLVVCDGSAFPSASGVNPMISIESIAHMNARGLAARLT
jgi:choline dehydrogenase-like flavoprotein